MALVHYFRERRHRNARIPSSMVFNTCKDYLGFSDQFLIQRFRMDRQAILELFDLIREDVECTTSRSHALPLETKVTSALKLYASGTFQNTVGEMSGISQSSMSRIIAQVTAALANKANHYITFPTEDQLQHVKQQFYNIAGFPNILSAIDCTHIQLRPPSLTEAVFRNRKQTHSINADVMLT
ncbi:UNVERIFIED_CONTAM: hypothetical protein FKN15_076123 [Acipenser sinensis]